MAGNDVNFKTCAAYRQVHSLRHQTMLLFSGIECQCPVGGKTSISAIVAYGKCVLIILSNSMFFDCM